MSFKGWIKSQKWQLTGMSYTIPMATTRKSLNVTPVSSHRRVRGPEHTVG